MMAQLHYHHAGGLEAAAAPGMRVHVLLMIMLSTHYIGWMTAGSFGRI